MTKIKINVKNQEKVEKLLDDVQKKSRTRTISYQDILDAVEDIEKKFNMCSKKSKIGLKVFFNKHMQKFPNAYKYTPRGTEVILEYFSSGFFITKISREFCGKSYDYTYVYNLTEKMKNDILNSYAHSI